jgi:TPR repeat protein
VHGAGAFSFEHFHFIAATLLSYISHLRAGLCALDSTSREQQQRRVTAMSFRYSLLSRGRDTVRAANRGNASSQAELGDFHFLSATRLDILQGAPADDAMVAARWSEALRFLEGAAEQGVMAAQARCGLIYASTSLPGWYMKTTLLH